MFFPECSWENKSKQCGHYFVMKEKYNNADIISSFSAARSSYTDLIASKDGNDLEVSSGNSKENEPMDGNPQILKE